MKSTSRLVTVNLFPREGFKVRKNVENSTLRSSSRVTVEIAIGMYLLVLSSKFMVGKS